jgi:hypothetical protein
MRTYSFCDIDFRPIQTSLFHLNSRCKWDIINQTHSLDDYLLGVYFKIFLESFEQRSLKNLEKYLNFHHTIMLWLLLKNLLKLCHVKKNSNPLQILLLFKNIGYNVFKMFLVIFQSLDQFQKIQVYIPIHWK